MDEKYIIQRIPKSNLYTLSCGDIELVENVTFGEAVIMLENLMYTTGGTRDD